MADKLTTTLRRRDSLDTERRLYEPTWEDIGTFIVPRKSGIGAGRFRTPGEKRTERLFDSTVIHANELLASSIQGSLTSEAIHWFFLKTRNEDLNGIKEVTDWLDDCSRIIYAAFRHSNLYAELHESYIDLGAFGTAALYCETKAGPDRFNGFQFKTLQIGEYSIAEDAEGRVNVLFREFKLSAIEAAVKWGEALSAKAQEIAEKTPDALLPFLHAVYPREGGTYGARSKNKPFASCYIDLTGRKILSEGGYDIFPFLVPRWTKTSGEIYGRGPGWTALPDVKTLNKAVELGLRAWAKAIDPPVNVMDDGVIGEVRLRPSSINTIREKGAIEPMEFKSKFDVSQIKEDTLKAAIREVFFSNQLQLPSGPQMTATEVERRYELMQRLLGPTFGRLNNELYNPLIEYAFATMWEAGKLPPPPDAVREAAAQDTGVIDIEYEGPLARAQRASDVAAIERSFGLLAPLAQIQPDVMDNIDLDATTQEIVRSTGAPSKILRDPQAIIEMRNQRAQALQAEKAKEALAGAAESAGKAAPMMKVAAETGLLDRAGDQAGAETE